MTTTITSQTDTNKKYFLTIDEQGHATECSCPDRQWRQHQCKHMRALDTEVLRAEKFTALMRQYDVRSQAVREQRRAAYIENFQIYG